LDILTLFTTSRPRISASELAAEFGVARSTAYRYLQTLTTSGFIEEDPGGGFRLGLRVFELARVARQAYGLSEIVRPVMHELAESSGETALLTRRSGNQIVCLEREEPRHNLLRISYERGSTLSLNAGASALVLLAWENESTVADLLRTVELARFTPASLTSPAEILDRLKGIRDDGYVVSFGEVDPGAVGIAAPVRDGAGRVAAGLSLVAVEQRVPAHRLDHLIDQVKKAADYVTERLSLISQ
jgi:DNA-binding IclR family transcriptional regulator